MLAENPVRFINPNPSLDVLDRVADIMGTGQEVRDPLRWSEVYLRHERSWLLAHPDDERSMLEMRLLDSAINGDRSNVVYLLVHDALSFDYPDEGFIEDPLSVRRAETLKHLAYLVDRSSKST
jgi:hypothetical protein